MQATEITLKADSPTRACSKSQAVCRTASALIPGGVTSAFDPWYRPVCPDGGGQPVWPVGTPPVVAKGKGAILVDVDGNEFVDYIGAHGALILGHADERVVAAISKAASKGSGFGAPSELEVRLAELIASRFLTIDMVRLFHTPADTLTYAVQLARHQTGRHRVVTFEGAWHGHTGGILADAVEPSRKSARGETGRESSRFVLPFNDVAAVGGPFRKDGSNVAGVVVEPIGMSMGPMPPADGFLETLRSLCDTHGALLIFDETATGMRVASGGASMLYGVSPDLTLLGPIIGGGFPLAACGGRKEIMNQPDDRVPSEFVSTAHSPLSGNTLAVAAGVATLQAVGESGFYEELEAKSARLDEGLRASAALAGVSIQHTRVGSILGTGFAQRPAAQLQRDLPAEVSLVDECDTALFARYFQGMLDRGILLPPSPRACLFVSAAHTNEDIDRTVQASHEAMQAAVR